VSGLKLNEKSSCQAVEDLSNIREVSTLSSRNNDEIVTGGQGTRALSPFLEHP
jgi:hypothetical protein